MQSLSKVFVLNLLPRLRNIQQNSLVDALTYETNQAFDYNNIYSLKEIY